MSYSGDSKALYKDKLPRSLNKKHALSLIKLVKDSSQKQFQQDMYRYLTFLQKLLCQYKFGGQWIKFKHYMYLSPATPLSLTCTLKSLFSHFDLFLAVFVTYSWPPSAHLHVLTGFPFAKPYIIKVNYPFFHWGLSWIFQSELIGKENLILIPCCPDTWHKPAVI